MKKILLFLVLFLNINFAWALTPTQLILFSSGCPQTVLQAAGVCSNVDLNFATNQYFVKGIGYVPVTSLISTTRAQTVTSYASDLAGNLISFSANTPRITNQGLLVEESRTNDALWARDLTNAAWVKVNTTTSLNATGADGTANAATTLTATAGNATVLQTITLGSQADTSSVYLKCVTCTGNIQITENNGTAWTTCASLVTNGFVRCSVTATLANPIIGIRIVNSGDSVVADFFQMEPGSFATSPIPTTTVAVARNADAVTGIGSLLTMPQAGSILFTTTLFQATGTAATRGELFFVGNDSTNNNRLGIRGFDTAVSTNPAFVVGNGTNNSSLSDVNVAANTQYKVAGAWDAVSSSMAMNNRAAVTGGNAWNKVTSAVSFGSSNTAGANFLDGYISRMTMWNVRLSDTTIKALTQ